ncbi:MULTISPECIES: antitoxin Xre/MbcA/ParS toxin-binding domain-containing protein [Sphingomonas]|uniref:antitoxin Xre/MbcA/ParS toxin-binding domain-containing protein n=1 Tax=Sphingomonas TaxID=13687 RepID=UPI0013B3D604|nr:MULTISPECIES: antitoxin Xre/MbcA/ParS toxin-binding domain-containing protein [Sphingomonas]
MAETSSVSELARVDSSRHLAAVEAGLPVKMLRVMMRDYGLTLTNLAGVIAVRRTLERRLDSGERFTLEESERLARLVRALDLAGEIFDDRARAREWLTDVKHSFGDRSPLSLLKTEAGGRWVEERLLQLKYGIYS